MQARTSVPAIVLAFAVSASVQAFAQHEGHAHGKEADKAATHAGKPITLQGEVLDMACYMAHEGKGPKHKACAQTCIDQGAPVGILTADGKVYFLVENHDARKPFETLKAKAAEQVKVTGTLYERGGTQAVVVGTVESAK